MTALRLACALDPAEAAKRRIKMHVALGRYMRQPISEIERLTQDEVDAYLQALGEMFELEGGTKHGEDSS